MLLNLSRVRDVLDRAKNNPDGLAGLLIFQAEMKSLYTKTRRICDILRAELKAVENPSKNGPPNPHGLPPAWIHPHIQRFYGLAITIALYMNYGAVVLRTPDLALISDATYLVLEIIDVAENANQYRPFGAAYVMLGLIAASMVVDDPFMQELLHSWIEDYRHDFNMPTMGELHVAEAFGRLDPFGYQAMPEICSEPEEHTLYNPVSQDE